MQKKPPLLQSLAASIQACAQSITAYCDEVHYPQASFEPDAPSILLPSTAPQHLLEAQQTLLESVVQLQHLAFDVSDFLPCQQVYVPICLPLAPPLPQLTLHSNSINNSPPCNGFATSTSSPTFPLPRRSPTPLSPLLPPFLSPSSAASLQ